LTRKDERGRVSGFLYKADDPAKKDYLDGRTFGRRVFISFARESVELAAAFEDSLRSAGLEPWRYTPASELERQTPVPPKSSDDFASQIELFRREHPEVPEALEATVRRCTAVLLLISEASRRSAICEVEAWATWMVHGYGQEKDAAVYVILEQPGLAPPPTLSKFWHRTYEPGLEVALAQVIAAEIDAQGHKLRLIEEYRAKVYR
jgi:hypothetical protein